MIYKKKPSKFKASFEVVSCFFEFDGELLFLKRLEHKSQGGKWGIPTGKVDTNEDKITALVREIFEETGITVLPENLEYFTSIYVDHGYDFIYHMYHYQLSKKLLVKISTSEHETYQWIAIDKALEVDLVDDLDECIKMFYFPK